MARTSPHLKDPKIMAKREKGYRRYLRERKRQKNEAKGGTGVTRIEAPAAAVAKALRDKRSAQNGAYVKQKDRMVTIAKLIVAVAKEYN